MTFFLFFLSINFLFVTISRVHTKHLFSQETCNNKTGVTSEVNTNPYRELVEKYQALLEVQRLSAPRRKNSIPTIGGGCMSLQEELEMSGEYNCFQNPSTDNELQQEGVTKSGTIVSNTGGGGGGRRGKGENVGKKAFSATPTDFSEAETSSSGFSDETSNKATQTDGRPGSFLCSIADGEDCKFSIYDDNSPFESRFRKTPEYRQIFSEIFRVLKRAAEAKDEGEKLPLLDDQTNNGGNGTNGTSGANDKAHTENRNGATTNFGDDDVPSEATDDNQSVMSSVISSVVSEPPYKMQTPVTSKESNTKKESNDKSHTDLSSKNEKKRLDDRATKLDYVYVNVHVKKNGRSSAKKNAAKKLAFNERPKTPNVVPTTNPTFVQGRSNSGGGRRRFRALNPIEHEGINVWNNTGTNAPQYNHPKTRESPNAIRKTQTFVNRNVTEQNSHSFEYSEYKPSTASEEVAKLKRLELSYAEVLRMPNKSKANHHRS